MKGLLIKDFRLMKNQQLSVLLIAVIVVTFLSKDASFSVGYMTIIGALFPLSTISYDHFDNGQPFLFSLPITRKMYAIEKYVFGLIVGTVMCLMGTAVIIFRQGGAEIAAITAAFSQLAVLILLLSVTIPFQFKFGPEKSRYVMIGMSGLITAAGFIIVKAAQFFKIDIISEAANLLNTRPGLSAGTLGAFVTAAFLVSVKISINIMNGKEF